MMQWYRGLSRAFRAKLATALALAAASVIAFTCLVGTDATPDAASGRRLLAAKELKWDAKNISGIVLSVLVSLTSSIDRECGISLYMVLFAVLLNQPFRTAIAMTTFTVACGSLAPGIAAMSEPHVTERGVLALVDYAGALILLPTMFYGLSWGIIVNSWLPNWLLALLWVLFMAISNTELIYSYVRIRRLKRDAGRVLRQLQALDPATVSSSTAVHRGPTATSPTQKDSDSILYQHNGGITVIAGSKDASYDASDALDIGASAGTSASVKDAAVTAVDVAVPAADTTAARQELIQELQSIAKSAAHIESIALLYPAFHMPAIQKVLDQHQHGDPGSPALLDQVRDREATASTLMLMADDKQQLQEVLEQQRWAGTRFTLKWKDWWKLQNHFELALLFKVVILHLITEAFRHKSSKPCTPRYWIMLCLVTGCVTLFLIFVTVSYSRRRLWRGPHWVDAYEAVSRKKKFEAQHPETPEDAAANSAGEDQGTTAAVISSGDAVTVDIQQDPAAADGSREAKKQRRCCSNCGKRLPWKWVPAAEALSNLSACNSHDSYKSWTLPNLLCAVAVTFVIGVLGCALGLPGGPMMAYLLLGFGLKPHVVAGTSRFLVLCFFFGCFVAYAILGTYHKKLAMAYGLLNLGLAPLGMLLFNRLRMRSQHLLLASFVMGFVGMAAVFVYQLIPLLANAAGTGHQLPDHVQFGPVRASVIDDGNAFDINRFCDSGH